MKMGIKKNGFRLAVRKLILCSALIHAACQTQWASSLLSSAISIDLQAIATCGHSGQLPACVMAHHALCQVRLMYSPSYMVPGILPRRLGSLLMG